MPEILTNTSFLRLLLARSGLPQALRLTSTSLPRLRSVTAARHKSVQVTNDDQSQYGLFAPTYLLWMNQ